MTPENLRFVEVYNNIENFHSVSDVAKELNIAIKTVRNKASIIRNLAKKDPSVVMPIFRSPINDNPMSENAAKFMESWGPEECIEELRRVAEIDDEKIVTRNYFRNHSSISESTWNRWFGTFEEFKRQAGIKLSRQQHQLERQIAKHASVDHYRRISVERLDYAEKYIREGDNRFKTILACSDLHDVDIDPFYLRVLIDTAKRVQPDVISLVGDTFDAAEFGKYTVDPRDWDIVGKIKFVHENIFKPLREACPDAQIDLIEGNHECVQKDTEILTSDGWVTASEITSDSEVASYTLDGEAITFRAPLALKTIESADLWSVTGDLSDELVSSTHRIDVDGKLQNVMGFSEVNQARFRYAINSGVKGDRILKLLNDKIKVGLGTPDTTRASPFTWTTVSKNDADIVQLACILHGIPCKIQSVQEDSDFGDSRTKYYVSIFNNGVSNKRYVKVGKTHTTGTVVAIQTINGTIVTRRNGKVAFTGNCRLLRQLADATPALRAVLSDLHGFTIGKLLGLDDYQINYVAKANLAAWSKRDADKELANNYKIYWDSVICHHFPHARNMGLPGVNGHHHRHQVWGMFNPVYGPYEWHQLGAGHVRSASYCEGEVWHNGFAIVNIDTQKHSVNFDYVPVTDFAVSGGKWYLRNSDEEVASVPKNIFV